MKIANSVTVRVFIATALCVSFLIYPQMRISSVAAVAADEPKSESQFKSEAARYERAIRAIGGIATMKLDTADGLKQAIAIVDRERPNLKLYRSKLVAMAIGDSTFVSAVKKVAANESAAETFLKNLNADRKIVLNLEGTKSLQTRMERSIEGDAAILRQAGERLKAAADSFKPTSQQRGAPDSRSQDGYTFVRVRADETRPFGSPVSSVLPPVDPVTIIAGIAIAAAVIVAGVFAVTAIRNLYNNTFTEEGRDEVAECQKDADDRLGACVSAANKQFFPFNLPLLAACDAQWLISQAKCLLTS
jgi:hypothetical protein